MGFLSGLNSFAQSVDDLNQTPQIKPDPTARIPDRGFGPRYHDEWGSIPPYDLPYKGRGFYGNITRRDNASKFSGEYSIGVTIDGKNYHVPSMVPGLTQYEIDQLLRGKILPSVTQKATDWARMRIRAGLPVFATAPEEGAYRPIQDQNVFGGQ